MSLDSIADFMEREWARENARHFQGRVGPADWEWQEFCLAAYEDGEIVGSAIGRVRGGVAHLKNVISTDARRSRGIGGALLDEFEKRARDLGCHKLTLVTYYDEPSLRFYRRHGLEVEAVLSDDAFHVDRCQMCKRLEVR